MIYIVLILLCACILMVMYMVREAFDNNVLHHEIQLKGKEDEIKLFFISDIHVRKIHEDLIQEIQGKYDAVIIGGDLADKRTPIERISENLKLLTTLGPVYFIWGNNDREVGEQRIRDIFSESNVAVIENDALMLPNSVNRIWLSAIDDTSTRNARFDQALEKCGADDIVIFISHNPQIFHRVKQYENIKLFLGGHLHGGQIRFGPFAVYPHGSIKKKGDQTTLISNGYGTTLAPLRLGAKPQCHIIHIKFIA